LTGEADKQIVFIHNAGAANQTESFINLLGTNGKTISGVPDDTAFPTATKGFFYLTDTGADTVYRVTATGLTPGSVYVDVGDEFGSLNLKTGVVTPIFTGISPHGVEFVPFATPEPASIGFASAGVIFLTVIATVRRKRTPRSSTVGS
jgi:hypothetical protein